METLGQRSFKFLLEPSAGGCDVWGIRIDFDLASEASPEKISAWLHSRQLLHFIFPSVEEALSQFVAQPHKGFLSWFEIPYTFLSTRAEIAARIVGMNKIFHVPPSSSSREAKFLARCLSALGDVPAPLTPLKAREKLLLHVCCGPDAAGVVKQLKEDFDLSCYWYDPNIQPREEYDLRLDAFKKVMEHYQIPFIEGPYDVDNFEAKIAGLQWSPEQGAKCSLCYDQRLEKSAQIARELNFDSYATTLAISPHKVQKKLEHFGELNFKRYGIRYYHKNFVKQDGFRDSVEFTTEHNIYRQDYCGCFYSLHEGGPEARAKAAEWGYLPPAGYRSTPTPKG